jgi:hypothetical protein
MNIGKVTVGNKTQTTIASPSPTLNKKELGVSDLIDVNDVVVEDGYILIYNSVTQKYDTAPITAADVVIAHIYGGSF